MSWSAEDLSNIEDAIIKLATGHRVVQTEVGGKPREFARAGLDGLKALRADIQAELGLAAPRTYAKMVRP